MSNQSTNKIYASQPGSPPIIQRTIADSRLKDKNDLRGIPTPAAVNPHSSSGLTSPSTSTDKYYASPKVVPQIRVKPEALPSNAVTLPPVPADQEMLQVFGEADYRDKVQTAVARLQQGAVKVTLVFSDELLRKRAQVYFDVQTTRNSITEDQRRDIVLALLNPGVADVKVVEDAASGVELGTGTVNNLTAEVPTPTSTINTDDEEDIGDPAAFVYGTDRVPESAEVVEPETKAEETTDDDVDEDVEEDEEDSD